jgi:pimeloyl-ACP methyl ester carboxylesterase
VLGVLARLLSLQWRRRGARLGEVRAAGARVWYAEFAPRPHRPPAAPRRAHPREGPGRARRARAGAPPTVVLLHGLGASSASFFPIVEALREAYRVVVPDLPGAGWSRTPRGRPFPTFAEIVDSAEAFVRAVAPGGAYLAGNSMGGWIAAKVAARRPELVRGVALINPGGPALDAQDWTVLGRVVAGTGAVGSADLGGRIFARAPRAAARLLGREVARLLSAPAVVHLMSTLTAEDFLSGEELARVACPAVLIWGESDRFIPSACRDFFLEKLPHVRHEPIPDCGHCPQLECPRRTAEILLRLPRMRRAGPPAAPVRRRGAAPELSAPRRSRAASAGARPSRSR